MSSSQVVEVKAEVDAVVVAAASDPRKRDEMAASLGRAAGLMPEPCEAELLIEREPTLMGLGDLTARDLLLS